MGGLPDRSWPGRSQGRGQAVPVMGRELPALPSCPLLVPCWVYAGSRKAGRVRPMSRVASRAAAPAWPRGALAWAQGVGPEPGLPTWGQPQALPAHIALLGPGFGLQVQRT